MLIQIPLPRETLAAPLTSCHGASEIRSRTAFSLGTMYLAAVAYQTRFVAERLHIAAGFFACVRPRVLALMASVFHQSLEVIDSQEELP